MSEILVVVVYRNPSGYATPCYVARRQWARNGRIEVEPLPIMVAPSLGAIHQCIPPGMTCLPPDPADEPQIVETWI